MKLFGLDFDLGHSFYPSMYGIMIQNEGEFCFVPVLGLLGLGFFSFVVWTGIFRFLFGV